MGTNQSGKNIFGFKTRKDQIYAVISLPVAIGIVTYLIKFGILLWNVFAVASSFATISQLADLDKSLRVYSDTAIAAERVEREKIDEKNQTKNESEDRYIRDKIIELFGKVRR